MESFLHENRVFTHSKMEQDLKLSKSHARHRIEKLIEDKHVRIKSSGPSTRYVLLDNEK
ncbi:MAG: hypothetical protein GX079_07035 [Tissierellia bacterium]|nr:hypothetical protein [Tissierellia bacterium]